MIVNSDVLGRGGKYLHTICAVRRSVNISALISILDTEGNLKTLRLHAECEGKFRKTKSEVDAANPLPHLEGRGFS